MIQNPPPSAATARRAFIKTAVIGAAAGGLSVGPFATVSAQAVASDIITRKVPKTGEVLPAIGLGAYLTFDRLPGKPRDLLREGFKRLRLGPGRPQRAVMLTVRLACG